MIKQLCSKIVVPLSALSLTLGVLPLQNANAAVLHQPVMVHGSAMQKPLHMQKIAPQGPAPTAKQKQIKRVWNLHDADIKAVITTMAQLTGQTFLIDPNINGRVSIVSKKPMTVPELYQVFLTMLQTLNYTAVKQGLVTRIVPLSDAKQYAREVPLKAGIAKKLNQQIVIDVIPVQHVSALQLINVLQPLMPSSGLISAYSPSNAIVISGTAELVAHMRNLIQSLDSQSGNDLAEVKLKNATAKTLVKLLQQLQANDAKEGKNNTVSYAADNETNSILVSGSKQNLKQAKDLIHRLDQSSSKIDSGLTVIHLQYVSAATIVPILAKLAGGNVTSTGSGSSGDNSSLSQSLMGALASGMNGNSTDQTTDQSMDGSMGGNTTGMGTIGADTSSIFQTPQVISGGGKDFSLVAVPSTNNIIASAPAQMVTKLKKIVKLLDVRPKQVLVQAIIVRINQKLESQLGINWLNMVNGKTQEGTVLLEHISISAILTAINNDNDSDVLATPSIVVENNQKATIADGQNISIPTGSIVSTNGEITNNTSRQNIMLSLMVRPQINSNNSVTLTIAQQDNELDQSEIDQAASSGDSTAADSLPIDTSTITTQVMVPNNDVLVLGGLLRKERSVEKTGIPILSKIPLLGRLFTFRNVNHVKQNLLIFLKPQVLQNVDDDKKLSHHLYNGIRTEQLKDAASDDPNNSNLDPVLPAIASQSHLQLPQPFATHHHEH